MRTESLAKGTFGAGVVVAVVLFLISSVPSVAEVVDVNGNPLYDKNGEPIYINDSPIAYSQSEYGLIEAVDVKILTPYSKAKTRYSKLPTQGLFKPYEAIPVGSWPEVVAIGDVNNDGRNDVVLATSFYFDPENDNKIHVFLQNENGGLDSSVKYFAGNSPRGIDIADVNSDNLEDVVVANAYDNTIGIFFQGNNGVLNPMVTLATGISPDGVKIGDLNGDGRNDIAVSHWNANVVTTFIQDGSITGFQRVDYPVPSAGYDEIDINDVDGNHLADVIKMNGQLYARPNLAILTQNKEGILEGPWNYSIGQNILSHGQGSGLLNRGLRKDIALTHGGNMPSASIAIFYQINIGLLDPAVTRSAYQCPEPLEVADVNHDGLEDIVIAHGGWVRLSVYLQHRKTGFSSGYQLYAIPYASHYKPQGLAIGDIDGNGSLDVVLADYNNGLIILRNTTNIRTD